MTLKLRIVVLEDNPSDFELEMHQLKRAGIEVSAVRVQTEREYLAQLGAFSPDLIIADFSLPSYDGFSALDAARRVCPEVPFLFISGTAGEEVAVEALKRGATDYVLKQQLIRLAPAVHRAIMEAEHGRELRLAEQRIRDAGLLYQSLVENLPQYVYRRDIPGRYTFINQKMCSLLGYSAGQAIGRTACDIWPGDTAPRLAELEKWTLESGNPMETEFELPMPGGEARIMHLALIPLLETGGQIVGLQGIFWDVTESRKAQARIEHLNQLLRAIRAINSLMIKERDPKKLLQEACEILVQTRDYLLVWAAGVQSGSAQVVPLARAGRGADYVDQVTVAWDESPEGRGPIGSSIRNRAPHIVNDTASDPDFIPWRDHALARRFRSVASFPVFHESRVFGALAVYADRPGAFDAEEVNLLTELAADLGFAARSAEYENESRLFQSQFLQAQKMEAVGRLAGGIAHDFNNLLTIIVGCSNFILADAAPDDPIRADAEQIYKAGTRAADLTAKLLAFSRKQFLQPRVLDLNTLVQDNARFLPRLIGEDIELVTLPGSDLGRVRADMTQVDQVIMNLVVNARDAMPNGGMLTIATENADLDQDFARSNPGSHPGAFVVLSVSDTGVGMDAEVKSHIFEPFFTTKEEGKGTGLGMSMVYGVVKQSGGYITVDSSPGRGSTFRIYLPRVDDTEVRAPELPAGAVGGTETILLVEDVEEIRGMAKRALKARGYCVLEAEDGPRALQVAAEYADRIHLLAVDLVLPGGINGLDLAERMQASRPGIKSLYVSGYPGTSDGKQILDPGIEVLPKPYSGEDLVRRVSEVLRRQA